MHPRSARVLPVATAGPRALRGHPEIHRRPISARARPGRHAASELAADVAVAETSAPAAGQHVDRCSS
eukprot:2029142-Prymnesium_polylepis.1